MLGGAPSAALRGIVYAESTSAYEWEWTPHTHCGGTAPADVIARWHVRGVEREAIFVVE